MGNKHHSIANSGASAQNHADETSSAKLRLDDDFITRKEIILKQPSLLSEFSYFYKITELSNLYRLWFKVRQSKSLRPRYIKFNERLLDHLLIIQYRLRHGCFEFGPYQFFPVQEKTRRSIANAPLKDRIAHWLLYEHLMEQWQSKFIHHTYGNLPRKGTHAAVQKLASWTRKPSLTYALQLDISKYFFSIQHSILKCILFSKEGNSHIRDLLEELIDSFITSDEFDYLFPEDSSYRNTPYKGIPLGNLTSQIFANIYLNEFDHWVKETLCVSHYIRYVDDFIFLGDSVASLRKIEGKVLEKLSCIGLSVNPNKTAIRLIDKGIPFLGYIVWPNHISAGKYVRNRYGKLLRHMQGLNRLAAFSSYNGVFKHTGATR